MTIFGYRIPPIASLLVWAALWEIVGRADLTFLLPPLSDIFTRIVEIAQTKRFSNAMSITAQAVLIGNAISIVVGIPLGMLMGLSVVVDRIFLPWVNLFLSAPLTALVPVIMVLFGMGMTTVVLTVIMFTMWIIVLNARAGVHGISPSLRDMAHSFGASRWETFKRIYFWGALPEILAGLRIGAIRSVKGVVIGQLLVSVVGFGALFKIYSSNFLMEHFWAAVIVIFVLAFLLSEALVRVERKVDYYASNRN